MKKAKWIPEEIFCAAYLCVENKLKRIKKGGINK